MDVEEIFENLGEPLFAQEKESPAPKNKKPKALLPLMIGILAIIMVISALALMGR
jgi:hypothetical protein